MATEITEIYEFANKLTRNTKRIIAEIESAKQDFQSLATEKSTSMKLDPENVLRNILPQAREIFEEEVKNAIDMNREYSGLPIFQENLTNILVDNAFWILFNFLVLNEGISSAYAQMEYYAGDIDEFYSGVLHAREILEEESEGTKKLTLSQKAAYWANFVWPTDLYSTTIGMRFEEWKDKAPYWLFLENGNSSYSLAYPNFYGTHFFRQSLVKIQTIYQAAFYETNVVQDKDDTQDDALLLQRAVEEATIEFLNNPDAYQPGEVIRRFYDYRKGRTYQIYVTKKRNLGTRLAR